MPNLDRCEEQVENALKKLGWIIDPKPFFSRVGGFTIFVDLRATRANNGRMEQIIIVEVKCFADEQTNQDELYRAIGQYLVYRNGLRILSLDVPLYLAIPTTAYNDLFQREIVLASVREIQMKLIVVDLETEEVKQWLN